MTVEIAVQDLAGARIAKAEGADRVELCQALGATGGLTPSHGLIQAVSAQNLPQGAQVLIRPRGGSFIFDDDEKAVQLADVQAAVAAGAGGVVVGGMSQSGGLDLPFMEALADVANEEAEGLGRRVQLTCHRVFDVLPDLTKALESLIDLGYTRVLTSGGAPKVQLGLESLRSLASQAAGRIQIQAGGGVQIESIPSILATGVDAIHLSAKHQVPSAGGPGGGGPNSLIEQTDRPTVQAAIAAVRQYETS
ncbi:copper homeostasis protein [Bifidobacterium aemilianum]|uniref:PF03932 family protein CutC n=1 Tax=Bifidobacterium aemilianum TaxID=2493120 RepID=A0A366KCY4_9BIFI|nr:copper homeostasis protein CutC [Bifidobacterium aemilianum]RBP98531.1 copper homeostasis protein [Bifidobacterium aemilianum]